jgi:hypothetical protein
LKEDNCKGSVTMKLVTVSQMKAIEKEADASGVN